MLNQDTNDARASDGGETWGWGGQLGAVNPERQLSGAICLAALLSDGVATYAAYPNGTGRVAGVVRVSTDNAVSWRDHISFGDARVPFAYSGLTAMPADQGGMLGVIVRARPGRLSALSVP